MRIMVGPIRLGGEHAKSKALAAPVYGRTPRSSGTSVRVVGIEEGRAWMKDIRGQIHAMAKTVIGNGKAYLAAPSDLRNKNVTRWAMGRTNMPEEYEPLALHDVMGKLDLWYFLDCEACLESLGRIILEGKKLANLPWNDINSIINRKTITYDVGESLALTTDPRSARKEARPTSWEADDSSDEEDSLRRAIMLPLPHCDTPI